jgi:hypothetical protein
MINYQNESGAFSFGNFVWWVGVVEDRMDPKKLGRLRVRIMGYHTPDKEEIPTEDLFWAYPIQPITSAAMNGIGTTPLGSVEATWVIGFFRDGNFAQDPVIFGTFGGIPKDKKGHDSGEGFSDPNEYYPKDDFLQEPDTNRLARNEKISETSIQEQRDNEEIEIKIALNNGEWDELSTKYNAEYPYNHVRETESGMQEEWDDTSGVERFRRWHPNKSFVEEYPKGSTVRKISKDHFEIIEGDDHLLIKGKNGQTITINADMHVYVKGDVYMQVDGNFTQEVAKDYKLKIGGNWHVSTGGTQYHDATRIHLNKPGPQFETRGKKVWSPDTE